MTSTQSRRRLFSGLQFKQSATRVILAGALTAGAAIAGLASAQIATGTTGIDASGSTASEIAACNSGATPQDRETCLREARSASAEKRSGQLGGSSPLTANAMQRCDVFQGDEKVACQARVVGIGDSKGSVGGGGVVREVESVTVPADGSPVRVQPQTSSGTLLVIPDAKK